MLFSGIVLLVFVYFLVDRLVRMLKVGNYGNKHVLITGCDSGFGRELAIRLDTLGFPVFAGCLTEAGQGSLSSISSSRLHTLPLDVTDLDSVQNAEKFVRERLPDKQALWAVVNNAGVTGQLAPLEMCTRQDMLDVCHVNLFGPVEVTRVFLPYLRQSRGRVVNVVSVMGRFAAAPGPYCASKFGMEAVSDVLRRELAPHGVKVSLLEPGYFRTPLIGLDALMGKLEIAYKRSSPDVVDAYGGPSFMDRAKVLFKATHDLGSPNTHEVADAFVDALTSRFPRARYLVGWDAKFVFVPLSYMPEWLGDSLRIWFQNFLLRKSGFDA